MAYTNCRKCAKCGKSRAEDITVTYYRFPKPGIYNIIKAQAWAKFCWPNDVWDIPSLLSLHNRGKFLCGRHFSSDKYDDSARQHLNRFAVPDSAEVQDFLNERENILHQDSCLDSTEQPKSRVPLSQVFSHSVADLLNQGKQDNVRNKVEIEKCVQLGEDSVSISDENQNTGGQWDEEINMDEYTVDVVDASFSWNCPEKEIVIDDIADATEERNSRSADEVTTIDDDPDTEATEKVILPCIQCRETINGCAWVCLQCEDHFLCEGCEREFPHRDHYALRVPADRDPVEVATYLNKIRFEIGLNVDEIKEEALEEELKSESESVVPDCDSDSMPDSQAELSMEETPCALEPTPPPVTVDPLSDDSKTEIIRTVRSRRGNAALHKVPSLTNVLKANPGLLSQIKTYPTNVKNLKVICMNKTVVKSIAPVGASTQIQSQVKSAPQKRPAEAEGDDHRVKVARVVRKQSGQLETSGSSLSPKESVKSVKHKVPFRPRIIKRRT